MPENPSNAPVTPQRAQFGGFRIIEKIGEGGMGAVYRAQQASLNRPVALKILAPRFSNNPGYVESFRRESRAAAKLHHPNLISVFDAGEAEGVQYYAMEFVEGETLYRWLKREQRIEERTALEIALCIGNALRYAWEKERLIHRDVKPENVIIDPEGNVKLCDLGLAKTAGENTQLTLSGVALGTPHYVSPEQARGELNVDQRSDIYSLGMTLYHALTGQLPFPTGTPASVMAQHLTAQLADPRTLVPAISPRACRLLEKMLAKNPAERYATWDDALADMQRAHDGQMPQAAPLPQGASTLGRNAAMDVRAAASRPVVAAPSPRSKGPMVGVAAAVVLIITVALLGAFGVFSKKASPSGTAEGIHLNKTKGLTREQQAQQQLERLDAMAAQNPVDIAAVLAGLRALATQFGDTNAGALAPQRINQLAVLALQQIIEFSQKNPDRAEETQTRLRKLTADFADTPVAAAVGQWMQQPQQQAAAPVPQMVGQWIDLGAGWLKNAMAGGNVKIDIGKDGVRFGNNPPPKLDPEEEKRRAEQKRLEDEAKRVEDEKRRVQEEARLVEEKKRQQEEEANRLVEQQRLDEQSRQLAAQQAQEVAALAEAENKFAPTGRAYLAALSKRDYATARQLAQTAVADPTLAPLQPMLDGCLEMAAQLDAFWGGLQTNLSKLNGQDIELQSARGKVDEVTEKAIGIEKSAGASVNIMKSSLSFDEWLMLANRVSEKNDASLPLRLALFMFAEGKAERAATFFEQARTLGTDTTAMQETVTALLKFIENEAAANTLTALRAAIAAKQWRTAGELYTKLVVPYAKTKAAQAATAELETLAAAIELATGQVAGPDEDKERREIVQRREGRILIVSKDAPEKGGRGPQGEPLFNDLGRAIDEAKSGDAIEVWDGLYRTGKLERTLKDLLIYGKAGSMPAIVVRDPAGWWPSLFSVGESLTLENLCITGETATGNGGQVLLFKMHSDKPSRVRLNNCVLAGGGPWAFAGGKQSVVELENCLLLNVQSLIEIKRGTELKMNRCTIVGAKQLFTMTPSSERSLIFSMQNSVLAGGLIAVERFDDWFGDLKKKEAPTPLRNQTTYTGDRNFYAREGGKIFDRQGAAHSELVDWRGLFQGQDAASVAIDSRNYADIFLNPPQGDFRLKSETRGARLALDGGVAGVRWSQWRWKAFQDRWPKLDIQIPKP